MALHDLDTEPEPEDLELPPLPPRPALDRIAIALERIAAMLEDGEVDVISSSSRELLFTVYMRRAR